MKFNEALGEVIREERHAQGLTMRSVADNGPIALGYLSEIERGQKDASSQVIDRIADGLGKKPYELVIEAGMKMFREAAPEVLYPPEDFEWLDQHPDLVK
jgi:transcriptional regulator with XRE-family HTH domain